MSEQKHNEPKSAKSIKLLVKTARAKATDKKETTTIIKAGKPTPKKRKRLQ